MKLSRATRLRIANYLAPILRDNGRHAKRIQVRDAAGNVVRSISKEEWLASLQSRAGIEGARLGKRDKFVACVTCGAVVRAGIRGPKQRRCWKCKQGHGRLPCQFCGRPRGKLADMCWTCEATVRKEAARVASTCSCGGKKTAGSGRCAECVRAASKAQHTCKKCGGPKSASSRHCSSCRNICKASCEICGARVGASTASRCAKSGQAARCWDHRRKPTGRPRSSGPVSARTLRRRQQQDRERGE